MAFKKLAVRYVLKKAPSIWPTRKVISSTVGATIAGYLGGLYLLVSPGAGQEELEAIRLLVDGLLYGAIMGISSLVFGYSVMDVYPEVVDEKENPALKEKVNFQSD